METSVAGPFDIGDEGDLLHVGFDGSVPSESDGRGDYTGRCDDGWGVYSQKCA